MTIHSLFTVHTLQLFHAFSNVLISLKRSDPYIKTFSTLSEVRMVFLIVPQLDILCISAVKWYYAQNDNSPYTCHLFPVHWSSWKQEKLSTE